MNRRISFQTAAALALLLFLTVRAEDWPQFRGPNRDGAWNETGIMESFPPGGLNISWRVPVGRGWSSPVVAWTPPAYANRHVFARNDEELVCASLAAKR